MLYNFMLANFFTKMFYQHYCHLFGLRPLPHFGFLCKKNKPQKKCKTSQKRVCHDPLGKSIINFSEVSTTDIYFCGLYHSVNLKVKVRLINCLIMITLFLPQSMKSKLIWSWPVIKWKLFTWINLVADLVKRDGLETDFLRPVLA